MLWTLRFMAPLHPLLNPHALPSILLWSLPYFTGSLSRSPSSERPFQTSFPKRVFLAHFLSFILVNLSPYNSSLSGNILNICVCVCVCVLSPWDLSGKNTEVGCHFLLQRIVQTQGSNLGLLSCRWLPYHLSHLGVPIFTYALSF